MQQERLSSAVIALVWYHAPYCATARGPRVETMSIILLLPVAISTSRSTDWPCALDMFDTTRSFKHISNTCVIRKLAFLNPGFIDLLSCTRSLSPSTASHQKIVVYPRTLKSWDCLREVGKFQMILLPFSVWVIGVAPRIMFLREVGCCNRAVAHEKGNTFLFSWSWEIHRNNVSIPGWSTLIFLRWDRT